MSPKKNRKLAARIVELFGTQADFANEIGYSAPTVCRMVNGRRPIYPEEARQIAKVLKMRVSEVLA